MSDRVRIGTQAGDTENDRRVAHRCAARIIDYWRRQGRAVSVSVEKVKVGGTYTYGVRSDMANGTPQNG